MKYGNFKLQHITAKQVENQVQEQLLRLLDNIPILKDVDVFSSSNKNYDIEAKAVTESGDRIIFLCEVKTSGEPKYIRSAIKQLLEYSVIFKDKDLINPYFMVAAPYISQQSSKICEEHNVGYIDLSGNCLIMYNGLYIRVEGKPNIYKDERKSRSIFERKAVKSSIILRTILTDIHKQWRVQDLAEATSSSLGQVSNVKKFLENKEYIMNGEQGFYVSKPKDLLYDWAKVYHMKPNTVIECYSIDPIPQIEGKLMRMREVKGVDYALTGFSGGVRYSPIVRYNKVHVYIPLQDLQESIDYLGLKEVESGSNVSIIVPYDPCVLLDTRELLAARIASPVQICLELLGLKGRGEEAAIGILDGEIMK
ncbi:hypothetical protein BK133_21340 [Paenibacillus sp. FSL H8-0548]|uniref:type IV toxin-antitoxin system AbiEi family antitoxin n=1 Tax=Paenibacillus sp. FSL H8-0548 TaxID=1920422 RepID=UPI00096D48F5|nr:type IV toxin-antitoxin system AbiEi family antitoxin [Paenibacillus sp. FSL H8-0548]OMF25638.1 hypothetical protein BK133_21340 [Paenibacillus sp. FSL H8-0548]